MQEAIFLVKLMQHSLQQDGAQFHDEVDEIKMGKLIREQGLISFVCPLLLMQENEKLKNVGKSLEREYNEELHRALVQGIEMDGLVEKMEQNKIDCLPLKGYIMKNYYIEPTFRSMTDFDVLLKVFDGDFLKDWMEEIGYEIGEQDEDHHDVYIKRPYMVVELHKDLSDEKVAKDVPIIDEWLEGVWDRCILEDGKQHTYKMTEEDFYIYHLIHLYKHMRSGGISIRPLVDTHVFLNEVGNRLNWAYIKDVLEQLGLTQFESRMKTLSAKCFEDGAKELNNEEKKLLMFFMQSGLFGSLKMFETSKVVTENGESYFSQRTGALWRAIFLPARLLKDKYPILVRYPFVLPFVWTARIIRVIFREKYKIEIMNEGGSRKEYDKMKEIFQIAGIKNK